MANLLKTGAVWLADQLAAHVSETVEIVRGTSACRPAVTRGSTDFEVIDEFGGVVQTRSVDFIVKRTNYDFGDGPVDPAAGDLFVTCEDQETVTYEVTPFGPGQQHFRPSDHAGEIVRVHTQRITVTGG